MLVASCGIMLLLVLTFLLVSQMDIKRLTPQVKVIPGPRYGACENFQNLGSDLPIGGGDSPALDQPRTPYGLLNDALPPLMLGQKHELINSQSCYEKDYMAQTSLTGNYTKRTNNNMPTYPDTCTGPRQEFILGFYQAPMQAFV
jgi:hypothetical protein